MKHVKLRLEKVSGGSGNGGIAAKILACLAATLLIWLSFSCAAIWMICKGPSEQARREFVSAAAKNSITNKIPALFFTEEEISALLQNTAVADSR